LGETTFAEAFKGLKGALSGATADLWNIEAEVVPADAAKLMLEGRRLRNASLLSMWQRF
jgi:hypothetical protein